ncbi:MAG TPA: 4-hydroxybenzoate octaprenyltransferase, partial [Terriglobia bacterium]|nr:4-hydroxybenzoate octaprenyltransferase [Terriglobia bacterium]
LKISSSLHAVMLLLLLLLVLLENLGWISLAGVGLVTYLLWYEHHLVRPEDLSKVNQAFFTVNGYISILLFLAVGLDKILHQLVHRG